MCVILAKCDFDDILSQKLPQKRFQNESHNLCGPSKGAGSKGVGNGLLADLVSQLV